MKIETSKRMKIKKKQIKQAKVKLHKILKFIEKQVDEKGYAPSVREIGKAVGLKSTATVDWLPMEGYLREDTFQKKRYLKRQQLCDLLRGGNGDQYGNQHLTR